MHNNADCLTPRKEKNCSLERQQLHDVTALAAELKRLLVRHQDALKEGGVNKEMRQLEDWLENERKGPAPAGVISASGIAWLTGVRNKLKLSADEAQRLEGEGGNPASREQAEKLDELLTTIRRIDRIINESTVEKTH